VGEKQTIVQGFSKFHAGVQKMVDHADANLKMRELLLMTDYFKDMGQGVVMAIEDVVGIATLLPRGTRAEGQIHGNLFFIQRN
jgi:hypothetical protein